MSSRLLRSLLLPALAASLASAQVEKAGTAAESSVGATPALAGASLTAAPIPVALTVTPLSAAPALAAPPAAFSALPAHEAPPAAAAPAAAPLAPALSAPAPLPVPAAEPGAPAAAASAVQARAEPRREERDGEASDADVGEGRALFDAAAAAKAEDPGLWTKIKGLAGFGERVPAWPGAAGDTVRVGKRAYTLGSPISKGVWWTYANTHIVRLAPPGMSFRSQADALRALEGTDIPRLGMVGVSADGRALVTEKNDDATAAALQARGYETHQAEAWAELAAKMIRAGATGDLSPENLIWQRWRGRWILSDVRGVRRAGPGEVLDGLLTPAARRAGVEPAAFLAGLRARLGPDSTAWARTNSALGPADRAALAARDRDFSSAPRLVFGPGEKAPFPDAAGPAAAVKKALGYDPLLADPRRLLHTDDPGKLNTLVFSVEPPGKARVAVKVAEWDMIRRELALRRVIRRWFGRWFDAPSAFGVERGFESYLVMEFKDGAPAHNRNSLTLEQRAALAVLVHAFGVWDMNPGNVLFPPGGKPVLIDFEQSLSRREPVASRLPDESIAMEMPWMSRFERNRAEDYQPAVRDWRKLWSAPEAKAAFAADLQAAGFTAEEAAYFVRIVDANTADLDWSIANDVEFVNQFVRKRED